MFDTHPRHFDHPRRRQRHERERGSNRIPSWIFGRLDPFAAGRPSVRRGDVRPLILAVLQRQPMHGYQVIQELEAQSGGRWRPSAGSVYPTLQQLEDESLVRSSEVDGRRVYSLTDEGRSAVARPGQLEDTGSSLDPLDAQATAERAGSQILDELRNGRDELRSLLGRRLWRER